MTEIVDVRAQHCFDEAALAVYLARHLPEIVPPIAIGQFQGGQSNPTFLLTDAAGRRYVLRKKPPGAILPSAHAVEREYAAMSALRGGAAPVPNARLLCEDPAVIGTPFYVMDYIDGRVLTDLRLTAIPLPERAAYYLAWPTVLPRCTGSIGAPSDWSGSGAPKPISRARLAAGPSSILRPTPRQTPTWRR